MEETSDAIFGALSPPLTVFLIFVSAQKLVWGWDFFFSLLKKYSLLQRKGQVPCPCSALQSWWVP